MAALRYLECQKGVFKPYYIYRAIVRWGALEGFHKIQANYAWCRPDILTEVPYSALVKGDGSYWILKDGKETEVSEEEALTHVLEEDMDYRMDYPF